MIGLGRGVFFGSMFLFGLLGRALKCVSIRIRKGGERSGRKKKGEWKGSESRRETGGRRERVITWIRSRSRQF